MDINHKEWQKIIPLENCLMGTLLKDPSGDKFINIYDKIFVSDFYDQTNATIFKLLEDLIVGKSSRVDVAILIAATDTSVTGKKIRELYKEEKAVVSELYNAVDSIVNASKLRQLTALSNKTTNDIQSINDAEQIIEQCEKALFDISERREDSYVTPADLIDSSVELIMHNTDLDGITGIPTGIAQLDKLTCGLQRGNLIIVAGRPSVGKCHGFNTPILMYDGTIKMVQNIKVGDQIMGDDSTPRNVLSLTRGREQMYWVRQKRGGMDYRINKSHILSLRKGRQDGPGNRGDLLDIELTEYIKKNEKFKSSWKGYKAPVKFNEKKLILDPYFLGIWLGDGSSDDSIIWNPDKEIIDYVYKYATELGQGVTIDKQNKSCYGYRITNGVKNNAKEKEKKIRYKLRKLGILGSGKAGDCRKNIPLIYLTSSEEQRLELLAGLLDTDGYYGNQESNCFEIVQKEKALAENIKFLCDGLGFKVSLRAKQATIKSINFECTVYRIVISGDTDRIPTKVLRKKARSKSMRRNHLNIGIELEEDIVDDYYGFVLDENHKYLLKDCTVIHNSLMALQLMIDNALNEKTVGYFNLDMTTHMVIERTISYVTEVPLHKIRSRNLSLEEREAIKKAIPKIKGMNLLIDSCSSLTPHQLLSKVRRMKMRSKTLDLICIDFVQCLSTKDFTFKSRNAEIEYIADSIREVAREFDVPVIAVSQLSRGVDSREDKRPILSDLRDSGSLEQNADLVIFVYRDSYYSKDTSDKSAELILAKQRNGPVGTVPITIEFDRQKIF